jgi:murein DD-endopeptidase MepM/ murein hydrolase activator NlpD
MRMLWREAAVAALLTGTLAACASPQYPAEVGEAPGGAPYAAPRPQYPIDPNSPDPGRAPAAAATYAPAPAAEDAPGAAPLSAPTPSVQSEPLPPPSPSADAGSRSGAPRLQYASMTTQADAPAPSQPMSTTSTSLPPAAPPAATPSTVPAAPSADDGLTPQQVVHDQSAAPPPPSRVERRGSAPVREAYVAPQVTREPSSAAAGGQVVSASGSVFENYEVQRGDHIDALARAFSTTRNVILEANASVRAPYLLHPGEILKVPVAKAYVARDGDTLAGVARRFSVNVDELAQLNHVSARAPLRSGEEIGLPSSMRDRGPQRGAGEVDYAEAAPYQPPVRQSPPPSASYASPSPVTPTPDHRMSQVAPAYTPSPAQAPRSSSSSYSAPSSSYSSPGYIAPASPPPPAASGYTDAEISQAARGRFVWPVRGDIVQKFGPQGVGRRNDGVDIKAAQGTVVKAAAQGEVVYAGDQVPGFGNLVLLKHADGWVTAYAHLDSVNVAMKQEVTQGQSLGSVGMSGGANQPELHFEVRYAPTPADKAKPVDPVLVLPMG